MRLIVRLSMAAWLIPIAFVAAAAEPTTAEKPREFAVRGTLPFHNFLSGPTAWNEEQYRAYLDRLAALKLNLVSFHCYTGGAERYVTYVEPMVRIKYRDVLPDAAFDTSMTARWGYRPLAVKDFAFGTGKLFDLPDGAQAFGARCAVTARSSEERYRGAQALMRRVLGMAHERGMRMALGFEFGIHPPELASVVPYYSRIPGALLPDPTAAVNIEIFRSALDDLVQAYPGLDYAWLWLQESPNFVPKAGIGGSFAEFYRKESHNFADAGNDDAVFTGVWSLCYIRQAQAYLARHAPKMRLVIGGFTGDAGDMRMRPIVKGLDRALPPDIIFACLNPDAETNRQIHIPALADIAKHRQVWSIAWLEGDCSLWHMQPRVTLVTEEVKAARRDGLTGVLGLHWRTEETRPTLDAFARAMSPPAEPFSVEGFYRDDCLRQYGPAATAELAPLLARMDRERWLAGLVSPEYFIYDPTWGRLKPQLAEKIRSTVAIIGRVREQTTVAKQRANLAWLADNFRGMLLLDQIGRKLEPAFGLKERWLKGEVAPAKLAAEVDAAGEQLAAAPVEELFRTFARRVRSQGELGELSSLNQKLWLEYRELQDFLAQRRAKASRSGTPVPDALLTAKLQKKGNHENTK